MSHASLLAYGSILEKLPARRRAIFEVVIRWTPGGGATCKTIARELGLARDSVSPRIGELKNIGALIECGLWKGETVYKINPEPPLLWDAPSKKRKPLFREGLEEAAKIAERFAEAYPLDIFPEPASGQHGSVDGCSARASRHASAQIARLIRESIR